VKGGGAANKQQTNGKFKQELELMLDAVFVLVGVCVHSGRGLFYSRPTKCNCQCCYFFFSLVPFLSPFLEQSPRHQNILFTLEKYHILQSTVYVSIFCCFHNVTTKNCCIFGAVDRQADCAE
jgi:hypothetical protein